MARAEINDWYSYQADRILPKPSHKRLPPSKAVRPEPEPASDPIEVTESEASDSMILRAFKFWQR